MQEETPTLASYHSRMISLNLIPWWVPFRNLTLPAYCKTHVLQWDRKYQGHSLQEICRATCFLAMIMTTDQAPLTKWRMSLVKQLMSSQVRLGIKALQQVPQAMQEVQVGKFKWWSVGARTKTRTYLTCCRSTTCQRGREETSLRLLSRRARNLLESSASRSRRSTAANPSKFFNLNRVMSRSKNLNNSINRKWSSSRGLLRMMFHKNLLLRLSKSRNRRMTSKT